MLPKIAKLFPSKKCSSYILYIQNMSLNIIKFNEHHAEKKKLLYQ